MVLKIVASALRWRYLVALVCSTTLLLSCNKADISITSGSINSSPSQFIKISGDLQSGTVNQDLPLPLTVKVSTSQGEPLAGIAVTFFVTSGGGSLSAPIVLTNTNGEAQVVWTLGTSTSVNQAVRVSSSSLPDLTFTATPLADVPAQLVISSAPATVRIGACSNAITLERQDAFGNPTNPGSISPITTSGRGSGNFYLASNCTGAANNAPDISAGESEVVLYFKDATSEILALDFASGGLTSVIHNLTVTIGFAPRVSYVTGDQPEQVKLADLNKDGKLDIVGNNFGANTITIHLGNGDGTFAAGVSYATGNGPRGIGVSDLNHDGNLDVVVHNWSASSYSVLMGNGDGTVDPAVTNAVGGSSLEVTLPDLNRDGDADLVSFSYGADNLVIRMGNGNGTFGGSTTYASCDGPLYSVQRDFDRDGDLDVVVSCILGDTISYYANNGSGVLAAKVDYTTGDGPGYMDTGDFNEDGNIDIIVSNESSDTMSIFMGNGNGTFQAKSDIAVGDLPLVVKTWDFNLDGHLDFSVVARNSSQYQIRYGRGDGTFEPVQAYATGGNANGTALGDVNNDGAIDAIIVANATDRVDVFLSSAAIRSGTLASEIQIPTISNPRDILTSDFNFDSHLDMAVVSSSAGANLLSVHLGVGDGSFGASTTYSLGISSLLSSNNIKSELGDFNRDGKLDIASVFAESDQLSIVFGDSTGAFSSPAVYGVGDSPRAIKSADLDNDGDLDLAISNFSDDNVSVYANNGNGVFSLLGNFATFTGPISLAITDMDRNGKLDLIAGTVNNQTSLLLGVGDGTMNAATDYPTGSNTVNLHVGDFDHDGISDVLAAHLSDDVATIYLGNNLGVFDIASNDVVSALSYDLTLDGELDVITASSGSSSSVVPYINDGSLAFTASDNEDAAGMLQAGVLGDFNEDGVMDAAYVSWEENVISIFKGRP